MQQLIKKNIKIPKKWLERFINSLPCGNISAMTTCDNSNPEMDAFSVVNYRKDSTHCFYQNRGKSELEISQEYFDPKSLSIYPVIQPLLTGEFLSQRLLHDIVVNFSFAVISGKFIFCFRLNHTFTHLLEAVNAGQDRPM